MSPLELLYVLSFGVATVACLAGAVRAARIDDREVRYGLVGLLVGSAGWAASHAGIFLVPWVPGKRLVYVLGLVLGFSTVWTWLYFCSAYTGRIYHRSRSLRRAALGVYLAVVAVKVTNPLHELYFTATVAETPFPHLAVNQGLFHWIVTGFSYALATVGLFVLFEAFLQADYDTRPLGVLTALTALPIALDVAGFVTPELVDVVYAPLGVGAFALGVLYVYEDRFLAVKVSTGTEDPTVVLNDEGRILDFDDDAGTLFPKIEEAKGDPFESVAPTEASDPGSDGERTVQGDGGAGEPVVAIDRGNGPEFYVETREEIAIGDESLGDVITYTDVTRSERRRRELERTYGELERERDRFANLFEHLPDPVNEVEFVDGEPVIRAVNPAFEATFGYDQRQVEGLNANEVVSPPAGETARSERLDDRAREGEVVTEEVRRETADGIRDFLFRGIPYRTDGTTRALGVYTDITDQKRRQRRLEVLNRVLRHNVRNEMTVVQGHAELLAEELDDDSLADSARALLTAAHEVTAISEQARDAEKAVRQSQEDPIDLRTVVESTVETARDRFPAATFETDLGGETVHVGATGLDVAIEQLLENAVEYNDRGGPTVRVVLRRSSSDWALVRVEDDGPGIPDHERAVVAGDRDVTQLEHGSGLGLWIVTWIVESGGGTVRFEASDLGGTAVQLRVPTVGDR